MSDLTVEQLPLVDIDISNLGGNAAFIGTALSTFLSGVVACQAFTYMQSNNDKWFLRLMVVLIILMDLGVTIFNNVFLHYFTILHFGNISKLVPQVERNYFITIELALGVTAVFIVELFFASHVYLLKRTHWSIPLFIATCAMAAYDGSAKQFKDPYLVFNRSSQIDFGLGGSLSALSDVTVTGALLWSFHQSRTGLKKTDSMLQTLFKYTVTRGILVTTFQIAYVIIFLVRNSTWEWACFQLMLSKIYVITMVAMLNSRKSIRANHSGVITVSEVGTGFANTRDIHSNFVVPIDSTAETGSYQLKEYSQGRTEMQSFQPTTVYISRVQEIDNVV
uniref:DUF6534 domain-containing protein n=1 Tax=Moniliophthora roreri TaxID=221103 RepID=A0A0W0FW44_MONRR